MVNRISDVELVDGARDFRLMRRSVAEAVVAMPERVRFSKGLFAWVGFETQWIPYENVERAEGESSWSFWKLVGYALEGIVAFSTAPLVAISVLGIVVFLLALVAAVFVIARALLFGDPVAGWPSTIVVVLALAGMQLLGMGVLGVYLAKTYEEAKRRPLYVIADQT